MVENEYVKHIKDQLKTAGFKLTPQRESIVKVLIHNEDAHLSAEEIYLRVKKIEPTIGLATVYRTLEILDDLGIVSKISFAEDGLIKFDLRSAGAQYFHHHLVCNRCGAIEEIHEDLLVDAVELVTKRYQFKVQDHQLIFHGLCANCQQQLNTLESNNKGE